MGEVESAEAGLARAVMGSARSRARTASAAKPRIANCGGLLAVAAMLCRAASDFAAQPLAGAAARRLPTSARVVELCTHDAARARDQLLRCFRVEGGDPSRKGTFLADDLAKASAAALGTAVGARRRPASAPRCPRSAPSSTRCMHADRVSAVGLQPLSSVLRVWLNLTHRCERGVDALLRVPALLQQIVRAVVELYLLYDADAGSGGTDHSVDRAHQVSRRRTLRHGQHPVTPSSLSFPAAQVPACDALQYALGVLTNAVESSEAPLGRLANMTVAVPPPLARQIGADGEEAEPGDQSCAVDLRGSAEGRACAVPGATLLALLCAHHVDTSGLSTPQAGGSGSDKQHTGDGSRGGAEGGAVAVEDAEVRPDQVVVAAYFAVLVGCLLDRGSGCHATAGAALVRRLRQQSAPSEGTGATERSQQEAEPKTGAVQGSRRALAQRLAAALGESEATVVSVLGQIARVLRAFVGMQSSAGVLTVEGARDVGRLIQRFEGTASNELLDSVRKLAQQQGREEGALLGDEPGVDTSVPTPVKRGLTTPQKQAMHVSPAGDGACELTGQRLLSSAEVNRAASAVSGGGASGDARGDVGRAPRSLAPSRSSSGSQRGVTPSWLRAPAGATPNSARALNGRGAARKSPTRTSSAHATTPPSWSTPQSRASARKRRLRNKGASTELGEEEEEDEVPAVEGGAAAVHSPSRTAAQSTPDRVGAARATGGAHSGLDLFAAPRRKIRKYGATQAAPTLTRE